MVQYRTRVERTQFRKLRRGDIYWLASARTVAPTVRFDRRNSLAGETVSTGKPTLTAVNDVSVAVVRVPGVFAGQRRLFG